MQEATGIAHAIAADTTTRLRQLAASWRIRTPVGVAAEQLEIAAREAGADLIVVGCRGLGARKRRRLGSVTEALLARMPASLLIARAPTDVV